MVFKNRRFRISIQKIKRQKVNLPFRTVNREQKISPLYGLSHTGEDKE